MPMRMANNTIFMHDHHKKKKCLPINSQNCKKKKRDRFRRITFLVGQRVLPLSSWPTWEEVVARSGCRGGGGGTREFDGGGDRVRGEWVRSSIRERREKNK